MPDHRITPASAPALGAPVPAASFACSAPADFGVHLIHAGDYGWCELARDRLAEAIDLAGVGPVRLVVRQLTTLQEAVRLGLRGAPTILILGIDLFAGTDEPVGVHRRRYVTPAGAEASPSVEQLVDALRRGYTSTPRVHAQAGNVGGSTDAARPPTLDGRGRRRQAGRFGHLHASAQHDIGRHPHGPPDMYEAAPGNQRRTH